MLLNKLETEFSYGVLLVTDDQSTDVIPEWSFVEDQVTSADTAAVIKVLHGDEGLVTVRVWDNETKVGGAMAFDGYLRLDSGMLRVSDALGTATLMIPTERGTHRLRIFVNSAVEADQVDLVIDT